MAKFQVESPVRGYSGEVAGVEFRHGVGHVEDATKGGRAALEYFRRRGYTLAAAADEDVEVSTPSDPPFVTDLAPFDPAAHSAPEVLAYLDGADVAEAGRVLDAEAAGKNRSTILKQRDDILATAPAADDSKGAEL